MARKGVLNAENLAALGPDRLASLLMELADADASVSKRLVLAVAETSGPAGVIKAVDRRLAALAGSRGYIDWEKARAYANELDGLRRVIAQTLTPLDPAAAAQRLETFLRLAPRVIERVDDSSGKVGGIFESAVADLGTVWTRAPDQDPKALAEKVLSLFVSDEYGVCDDIIAAAAPALRTAGLAALGDLAGAALADRSKPAKAHGFDGRRHKLQRVLTQVADALAGARRHRLHALAVSGPDQTRHVQGAHLTPRRVGKPDQERLKPVLQIAPPLRIRRHRRPAR